MKAVAIAVATLIVLAVLGTWCSDAWVDAPRTDAAPVGQSGDPLRTVATNAADGTPGATDGTRTMVDAAGPGATSRARIRLIVSTSQGQPAVGAEVHYLPPRPEDVRAEDLRAYEEASDWEVALAKRGIVAIADGEGRVEIEPDPESLACARLGDGYAEFPVQAAVDTQPQDYQVLLCRDVTLRVVVTDSAARPVAGQKCAVVVNGFSHREGTFSLGIGVGPTDGAGIATLPHALHQLGVDDRTVDATVTAFVERPALRGGAVVAEWRSPIAALAAQTTVPLVIPAGGTIVVRAKDASGAPFRGMVHLLEADGASFERSMHVDDHVFRHVPCGLRWRVVASVGDTEVTTPLLGPRDPDDVVEVAVQVPLHAWSLRCRVVRGDGAPLADASLRVHSPALDGPRVFGVSAPGLIHAEIEARSTVRHLTPLRVYVESPLCKPREIVIDRPAPPGIVDLGEIVVEPPAGETLLARVRLVSHEAPLPDRVEAALFTIQAGVLDAIAVSIEREGHTLDLRGVPPAGPLLFQCWAPGSVPYPMTSLRVGEHREVILQPAATLQVALRVPAVPSSALECVLQGVTEAQPHRSQPDEQGIVRWSDLSPGAYRLRFEVRNRLLHEEPAVVLAPGRNVWPTDGSPIDLRGKVTAVAVLVRSARDGSLLWPDLLAVEPHADALPAEMTVHDEGWILATNPPADVLVRAFGFVPVRLPRLVADATVAMQRCTEIAFAADDTFAWDSVRVRIIDDAVTDPLLRAFDFHPHGGEFQVTNDNTLRFAPETVLDLTPVLAGKPCATVRVVVGRESPQRVALR